MAEQLIISVGREFGSGGHVIAEQLAKRFQLPLYDSNLLEEITAERNLDHRELEKYDERPRNRFASRTVRGFSNSPQENIAKMQFEYLKKKADHGDSFVIVGRCAETVLRGNEGLITIFILADLEAKIERMMGLREINRTEAEALIKLQNKKRKAYHNHYCENKWGDSRNYELSINSSKLGIDRTIDFLEEYIKERRR